MSLFKSMEISASGLTAQRYRMDVISENIANQDTTRTADGTPYRRRLTVFQAKDGGGTFSDILGSYQQAVSGAGVKVASVQEDMTTDYEKVYDPEHPDADADGYVSYPNVDIEQEMTDMLSAVRSYEANVTALNNFKNIAMKALEIGK